MSFNIRSSGSYYATFDDSGLSTNRTYRLPNVDGTIITSNTTGSFPFSASFATTASYVLGGGGGASVTNPGNNYIITSDGTVGGLVGETNLSFDGSTLTLTGSAIISGTTRLTDVEEREETVSISAGTVTINLNNANVFEVTVNNIVNTFTISNPPTTNYAGSFTLVTTGNGSTYSWNWGSAVTWSGGTPPTITSTNGKKDVFGFITTNQGTNWYAFIGGQNL